MAVQGGTRSVRRGPAQVGGTQMGQDIGQQVSDKAGEAIDKVSEQAKQTAATQKDRLVGGLDATANAIRQTGQNVRRQQPLVAEYAEKAALRVDGVTDYLRERNVEDVVNDVQDYARRNKALFVGGSMLLGFLAARLIKSSGRRQMTQSSNLPETSMGGRSVDLTSSSPSTPISSGYMPVDEAAEDELQSESFERETASTVSGTRINGH